MSDKYREIPYNYTSFSDREIVLRFLGQETWDTIETLREKRVTGQSARLLFEILGDMWIVARNPFIFDDLLAHTKRRASLIGTLEERLAKIHERAKGNQSVLSLHNSAASAIETFSSNFDLVAMQRKEVAQKLAKVTRSGNVLFDGHARVAHVTDATDWRVEYPFVVINPDTEQEVLDIVNTCFELKLKIIPRGGGTGYTGSGVPCDPFTAVINTEKLDQLGLVEFTEISGQKEPIPVINAGAGVVTVRVAEAAGKHGLTFAVDPTSQDASTIGGNVAMNAGGKKAVQWGTTIDNLLSWKMISPSGRWLEVIRKNHNLGKIHDQALVEFEVLEHRDDEVISTIISVPGQLFRQAGLGKDVTDKFLSGIPGIQKEGCDGLITSARFVLHRLPVHTYTICLEFYGYDLALSVPAIVETRDLLSANQGIVLSGLEHLDWRYVKAVKYTPKASRSELPRMVLLVDISADHPEILETAAGQVIKAVESRGGEGFIARTAEARTHFWAARKRTAAIAEHTNAFKINEDVVIPLNQLASYTLGIERINIEQSLSNKIHTVQQLTKLFEGDTRTYSQCVSKLSSIEQKAIFANKCAAAITLLSRVEATWQAYLCNLDQSASQYASVKLDSPHTIAELFLKGDLRVSLKSEVIKPLDDLFIGLSMQAVQDCIRQAHKKAKQKRLFVALHMHAGDGNVHTNIPVNSSDYEMLQEADHIVDRVMALAKHLGGVISGEHGIGLTKIKYVAEQDLVEFTDYKRIVDSQDRFNPGKLSKQSGLQNAYTPSFRLLEAEALILEASSLGELNESIKNCLRCGKCKPVCATHVPRANLLYSPRNKILAASLIIEAVLYEEQTRRGISIRHYDEMNDLADHCTVCHKCASPCPVDIDFGDVTMGMRSLLRDMNQRRSHWGSRLALYFLNVSEPVKIRYLRQGMIRFGYRAQNVASWLLHRVPKAQASKAIVLHHHVSTKPPQSTTGKPNVARQLVQFVANPLPITAPNKTLRELLQIESAKTIPVIQAQESSSNSEPITPETVFYFPGCGSERLFSDIGLATIAMLRESGANVVLPPGYLCCGYPQNADGRPDLAKQMNTANRVLFHRIAATLKHMEIKHVIVSCGTCMDQLLGYQFDKIFPGCRQLDIHEYLMEKGLNFKSDGTQYLYHEPCHTPIKHHDALQVASKLLSSEVKETERCCGESGTFAISRPDIAEQVRYRKLEDLKDGIKSLQETNQHKNGSKAELEKTEIRLITSCPSCKQGLSRYSNDTGLSADYIVTEMARIKWGEQWHGVVIEQLNHHDVIDRVLL